MVILLVIYFVGVIKLYRLHILLLKILHKNYNNNNDKKNKYENDLVKRV